MKKPTKYSFDSLLGKYTDLLLAIDKKSFVSKSFDVVR